MIDNQCHRPGVGSVVVNVVLSADCEGLAMRRSKAEGFRKHELIRSEELRQMTKVNYASRDSKHGAYLREWIDDIPVRVVVIHS